MNRTAQPAGAQAHESVVAIHSSHRGKQTNSREKRSTVASRSSSIKASCNVGGYFSSDLGNLSEDSDLSKSGSAGLLLLRHFVVYLFRRLAFSWKKITKEAALCSLLAFEQICFCHSVDWISVVEKFLEILWLPAFGCSLVLILAFAFYLMPLNAVIMVSPLVMELIQLMLPRRRDRGRGQITEESEGQNDEVQRSIPLRRRASQVEVEVDELAARVDDMELVMARFQRMNPQKFNGDEPSSDPESWLQHYRLV
ncbi:ferrochelatase-2, chloroplastic-like [Dorcoceras hygrometricum]|uniref:Ferrochelatase-2, chloroplastic-like n=1 Tax=Dorcoceras hygrometricum TaxID=472368 RepID=A0A2Z7CAN9_9LAMI|nr:ferrochelatase-2, chloroplastic-like [Dorcoceras hygrometricum]